MFLISQKGENMKLCNSKSYLFCFVVLRLIADYGVDPNDGSLKVHYSDRLVILLREVPASFLHLVLYSLPKYSKLQTLHRNSASKQLF